MLRIIYEENVKLLRECAYAYYELDNPIATDEEYDELYHKVMKYELSHDIINKNSPTQFVGWKTKKDKIEECPTFWVGLYSKEGEISSKTYKRCPVFLETKKPGFMINKNKLIYAFFLDKSTTITAVGVFDNELNGNRIFHGPLRMEMYVRPEDVFTIMSDDLDIEIK